MNRKWQVAKYLIFDFFAAAISWTAFFIYRKAVIEPQLLGIDVPIEFTHRYYMGLAVIPVLWLLFYYITGFYDNIYRRSRLLELGQTFFTSLTGVIVIFFALILDDFIGSYKNYYNLFFTLFGLHFSLTYFFRLILTTQTIHRIHKRKIGFNTLLIGSNEKAEKVYKEMSSQKRPAGNLFTGFVGVKNNDDRILGKYLPQLGKINQLNEIIERHNIEEVIIATETREHEKLNGILTVLENRQVTIWGIPDLYDFLSGTVKSNAIYGSPLIKISNGLMPAWQEKTKRLLDIVLSMIAIVVFLPVFLALATIIKTTSNGPVIYKQERVGRFGKPFKILKLRSMVHGAENGRPALSSENDERITKIGRFLRKTHLDEIPQFFNVIKGDMSLVGPRPERKFYIEQIVKQAPHYTHLHKLRPGITSWGQVKYGYASNVEEMLERLPYDMLYLKNISLYIDFKILIYTLMVAFKANGK
ncbi:exopolysaccharide biosynthesis polyprenyl glycosylphosphotransferase [Tangfeifania diversioriginum]|uniref:Exopolysaccharide biosynthesis polyprenyl glycosylphosphotransferase n=1 Tax=Tangfeifania diversioriginum TaxID=1168035 RepID=A0A1M6MEM4_9BACT|nr:sugar transferase [Tangfeifania diversioriginum]SHJ81790.1 exopolysaccharide biosynthesis polyprenyl glycosylphosphotransferase [Tangfeifania diversioriginum]